MFYVRESQREPERAREIPEPELDNSDIFHSDDISTNLIYAGHLKDAANKRLVFSHLTNEGWPCTSTGTLSSVCESALQLASDNITGGCDGMTLGQLQLLRSGDQKYQY